MHRLTRLLIVLGCVAATVLCARTVFAGSVLQRSPVVDRLFPSRGAPAGTPPASPDGLPGLAWPAEGSAALHVAGEVVRSSNDDTPQPIASLAKVMTAYVVLTDYPLAAGSAGFTVHVTADDVADTARMRAQGQSVVAIAATERLTERQALEALLLPSANNVALMLADATGGRADLVAEMNRTAVRLGMSDTTYTDPSGFDTGTVSTARDQTRLADAAMKVPALAAFVQMTSAEIPVAGTVVNTNTLVGSGGWVGLKTGSDQAAGGCLMFARYSDVGGAQKLVTGAVLGQRTGPLIAAGIEAAATLVASLPGG